MSQSPVKAITLHKVEGHCIGQRKVTVNSWSDADAKLRAWAWCAPELGYDKCDFIVEWENGIKYSGRYDLKHFKVEIADLRAHIQRTAFFHMGVQTPTRMTRDEHRQLLSSPNHQTYARDYRRLLTRQDCGVKDIPPSQFEELN